MKCLKHAVTAIPAMALENEFHGAYRMKMFVTNFDDGTFNQYNPAGQDTLPRGRCCTISAGSGTGRGTCCSSC